MRAQVKLYVGDDDDRYIYIYISLFSALEQTHCAVVVCDSKRVTVALV